MLYTVECTFSNPSEEAGWNTFYSADKLPALISVPGFLTSQRFKALTSGSPVYLAIHTITGEDVLSSTHYRQKGGGNFARWQPFITDWYRNIYEGIEVAPSVGEGDYLLLCDSGPQSLVELGLTPSALQATALDKDPESRWMAVVSGSEITAFMDRLPSDVNLYQPLGCQLISA